MADLVWEVVFKGKLYRFGTDGYRTFYYEVRERDIVPTLEESLREIITSTDTALREFRTAVRNRHYVAGTPMYDLILKAESALLTLKESAELEVKREGR